MTANNITVDVSLWFQKVLKFSNSAMSQLYKCVRLMFIIGVRFLVFVDVNGLEENEEVIDDFDTGTATYWQLPNNSSTTIWQLSMHGELLPPGIDILRPPSVEGDGFLEVFPLSDTVAQIYSNVFDLLPGATVELTYWNSESTYTFRHTVLLVYNEFRQIDDETGTEPPLKSVLVYSAPLLTDQFFGWRTDLIDLKITEPSKIQIRIDGSILKTNETGLAVTKIVIKNGVEMSTTSSPSSTMLSSSSTPTEASSTIGSTLSHSTSTESTSTSSIPSSSSTSSTVIPTTISSSTTSSTILSILSVSSSSSTFSSSNPSLELSTTTTISSSPSTSLATDSTYPSTPPPPSGTNQLWTDVLIGVGVAILLILLISLLVVFCHKRYRRRAYLVESRQLEIGIIRQVKQLDNYPILPCKTDYDSPSNSLTN